MTGTTEKDGKLKLIVEVTAKRCLHFSKVIDEIWTCLETDNLTKAERSPSFERKVVQGKGVLGHYSICFGKGMGFGKGLGIGFGKGS